MVAIDCGGLRCNAPSVSPGKLIRYPFCKATSKVESAGENNVACAKATNSAVLGLLNAAAAI